MRPIHSIQEASLRFKTISIGRASFTRGLWNPLWSLLPPEQDPRLGHGILIH